MNWLTNVGIGKKIMGGYLVLALIMVVTVLIALGNISSNQVVNDRVFNLRAPTVLTTQKILGGMQQSLAGLRGWMILGKDQFKADRADAWVLLDENYAKLQKYSRNWTNPENVRRLEQAGTILAEFKQAQQEIEDISGTIDNTPANKILIEQAAPRASVIIREITNMINLEGKQAASQERKALLGMMADVRGSMGMSLANIRAFLLTGDEKFKQEFDTFWAKNTQRFADLKNSRGLLTSAQRISFDNLEQARNEFKSLPPQMFEIRGSNEWNLANLWLGTKAAPRAAKLIDIFDAMAANQEKLAFEDINLAKESADFLQSELLVLGAVAVLLALMVAFFVTRMVTVPVAKVAEGMKIIAKGDLSRRWEVNSNDELGRMLQDMNAMADALTEVVSDVTGGSIMITSAASQISSGNMDLSQRTEEQASSLEETASSMEEMTSTVKQNADNADQASQLAQTARDQAEAGGTVVSQAVTAMGEINTSSSKIADIISVVEEIAFQTNLLALNAAVEAARAGEQGRGFAVVASEVRVLAGRSADAAKEIKSLIEDSVNKVKAGSDLVDKSGETLQEIVTGVKKVTDIVFEIAAASQEQSSGIDQVNKAVTQMDEMTQQNASLVEEAASASEAMGEQAQELKALVSFFKLSERDHMVSNRPAVEHTHRTDSAVSQRIAPVKRQVAIASAGKGDGSWEDF